MNAEGIRKIQFLHLVFAFITLILVSSQVVAQTCRWAGTAPFCAGECGEGETEIDRASDGGGYIPNPPASGTPSFGNSCVTGTKALCCETPGKTCQWRGTAPFCDGDCEGFGKEAVPPAGSNSGKGCLTGSKAYCCKPAPIGSSSAPIQTQLEYAHFAAIWEKNSGPSRKGRHNLSTAEYQAEFDTPPGKGYRLVDVDGYHVGGKDFYTAIFEHSSGPAMLGSHGMTLTELLQEQDNNEKQGYRPTRISAWGIGDTAHYAAIWEKSSGPPRKLTPNIKLDNFKVSLDLLGAMGFRILEIDGYEKGGEEYYAAIWEKSPGPATYVYINMNSNQYQQQFDTQAGLGNRLIKVSGWGIGNTAHYAGIWVSVGTWRGIAPFCQGQCLAGEVEIAESIKGDGMACFQGTKVLCGKAPVPAWVTNHDMMSDGYQEQYDDRINDGYRLMGVRGYSVK